MSNPYTAIRVNGGWSIAHETDHSRPVFAGVATVGTMDETAAKALAIYLDRAYGEGFLAGARHVQNTVHKALYQAGSGLDLTH